MKLATIFVAAGLLVACQPSTLKAADTEAQALAREALAKKIRELQPTPAVTSAAPAAAAPIQAKPTPPPPPAQVAPVTSPRMAPAPATATAVKAAPATTPAVTQPPPPALTTPAPPPAAPPAAVNPVAAPAAAKSGRAAPTDIAKAREALHDKMNELGPVNPSEAPPVMAEGNNRPAVPVQSARKPKTTALIFPAIQGPSSPLAGAKQQQLNELLRRYQADEITPQQYHAERAKLVAQP